MRIRAVPVFSALAFLFSPSVFASLHLMQIEQLIGGVYGDANAQAIQLRMRSSGENQVSAGRIRAWDATGANPVLIVDMGTNVSGSALGSRILIASSGFLALTSPAGSADFLMTNVIPPSYLAAGSLTYENDAGNTIYWRISWGGANYTGPTSGASTNDTDGEFGPALDSALPTADARAVLFRNSAGAKSTSNLGDYNPTPIAAQFTNNAGATFTVSAPISSCPNAGCEHGDLDGDCKVDNNDLTIMLSAFSQTGRTHAQGDTNGDGRVDIGDLAALLAQYGQVCQ